ncbi:MAG: hypothetical protein KBS41_03210 [Oscillospiraceae bacterium]|nr:hypothetical protein [Candidatus Equicaccousia limihippi]
MDSIISGKQHTYFEIKKALAALAAKYPFCEIKSIGRSTAGRDISAIFIGRSKDYCTFCPSFWGADHLSPLILLRFAEEICQSLQSGKGMCGIDIRKALLGRGIIIMPLINPDGYDISLRGQDALPPDTAVLKMSGGNLSHWGFNLRGIDLDKNFFKNYNKIPATKGFGGYAPLTEAESVAVASFCRKNSLRHLITLICDNSGISFSDATGRGIKMAEIISATTGFTINLGDNEKNFGAFFAAEFFKPAVKIGAPGGTVANLSAGYALLKEALTLCVLM